MGYVQGRDCSIVIKTACREMGVPYAEETIREAVSLLMEEASIEGDGCCRALRKVCGVTGCVVTPLTMGTAPLLLFVAMGGAGLPLYVSETRGLYLCQLSLLPAEDGCRFDVVQERGGSRKLYEGCVVAGFELRIVRGEAVKLKLDIRGERPPAPCLYEAMAPTAMGERFMGDGARYRINGREYANIYGLTMAAQKEGGTRTEVWIKRALQQGMDMPELIEELLVTAQLLRDRYEHRHCGTFRVRFSGLALMSDETNVDAADAVIGPRRYYCAGLVQAEVFSKNEE
jgi:hypothetical protein